MVIERKTRDPKRSMKVKGRERGGGGGSGKSKRDDGGVGEGGK